MNDDENGCMILMICMMIVIVVGMCLDGCISSKEHDLEIKKLELQLRMYK